ncbi:MULTISPECIES: DUF5683 domain-containing protein [Aequorivita]|mgnify:FL=1|uniref:DUF5683 domain-containing protein n=2 Tax=Aequorivita TaxID=153265 RepID=A0A137RM70_9FLAO|nr:MULTISPECIES: DUF5683 domain-containing protein [Aequorivita]MAB56029.1 hypothetical protein [Aequorivita sp.]KJJ39088.1 hypothetical protein MB09_06605 [Aequorivita vladivostokensis]KXO01292.1 hypothetical protein LS48_02200 [Aequorivita aquimaris]MAO49147.1 hypothetical protein [Aequorivita sp.]MBF32419.1 hypothetical protein [Aequorivita sp.]
MKNNFLNIFFLIFATALFAQTSDTLTVKKEERVIVVNDSILPKEEYNPLAPAKAAFYSAVVPGLGQVYNKKYWKIPIIYAGMAAGVYFYKQQDDEYDRFRDAYKRRLAGYDDDEFQGISDDRLINAQKSAQKNKSISIIVTVAFYLLNVVDANVDAHLRQYEVSEDLSLQPNFDYNQFNAKPQYGMSLTYRFK